MLVVAFKLVYINETTPNVMRNRFEILCARCLRIFPFGGACLCCCQHCRIMVVVLIRTKMNCLEKGKAFKTQKVIYMSMITIIVLIFIRLQFAKKW